MKMELGQSLWVESSNRENFDTSGNGNYNTGLIIALGILIILIILLIELALWKTSREY